MSSTSAVPGATPAHSARPPRVREQARDALALMAFSAATSAALASCLLLITQLGR